MVENIRKMGHTGKNKGFKKKWCYHGGGCKHSFSSKQSPRRKITKFVGWWQLLHDVCHFCFRADCISIDIPSQSILNIILYLLKDISNLFEDYTIVYYILYKYRDLIRTTAAMHGLY